MIKFYKDEFDTKVLERNVFKLLIDEDIIDEKKLLSLFGNKDIGIILCTTVFSHKNISLLGELGFNLMTIRNTYKLPLSYYAKKEVNCSDFNIIQGSKTLIKFKCEDIKNMAYILASTSRYFKDKLIPREKSLDLYVNWINNSIYEHYADEFFLITTKNNKLIGLITLKIKNNSGFIDLIGVHNDFQGLGFGKILLQKGSQYFISSNIDDIFVVTEGENIPANVFYQKNNFIIDKVELVYHKHFKR
ncbi:GNAT family N-acetyltransferase [bacterium]|nr:GNAT family N-acetyltransferase [bacterium]